MWVSITEILLFVSYPILVLFSQNWELNIIEILGLIVFISILQELLAKNYIKIFPYWTLIIVLGLILGVILFVVFIGILVFTTLFISILSVNSDKIIGYEASKILTILTIPIANAIIFVSLTHIFSNWLVKSITKSRRINYRIKILLEGIFLIIGSVYISIAVSALIYVIFFSNILFAYLFGSIAFAWLSLSAISEIYTENGFYKVFKVT